MRRQLLTFTLATAAVLAVVGTSPAATITIDNPSFEGDLTNGDPNDWTNVGNVSVQSEGGTHPATPAGTKWFQPTASSGAYQLLDATLAANTIYTFKVLLGEKTDANTATHFEYGLYADQNNDATDNGSIIAGSSIPDTALAVGDPGTFSFTTSDTSDGEVIEDTVTFDTSTATLPAGIDFGDNLYVGLFVPGGSRIVMLYDDARLTSELIPEPATLALLGLGGAVMLGGRRRRG